MSQSGIGEVLGADAPFGTFQITVFAPSVDRSGEPIDLAYWREEALALLAGLFRGATAFPPARGAWRDDEKGGSILQEDVVMVVCYANPAAVTEEALRHLRDFLHRLGREARQGEVGAILDGTYYGITSFDPASPV